MVYQEYSGLGRQGFSPVLQYLYDTNSGVYRPVRATDFANATISVTGNVNIDDYVGISGNVQIIGSGGYIGVTGTVTTADVKAGTASNFTVSGSNGTCLLANVNRKSLLIQNLSSGTVLYTKLGAGAADNSFNIILKKGSETDDGLGGSYNDTVWTGDVSVSGTAATVRYIASEIS